MCSSFWQRMENDQQGGGDLLDIIRAGSGCGGPSPAVPSSYQWQFPSVPNHPMTVPSSNTGFGDPFSDLGQDPLLDELSATPTPINCPNSSIPGLFNVGSDLGRSSSSSNGDLLSSHKILGEDMSRPCDIFSRFIQISPNGRRNDPLVSDVIRPPPPPILVGGGEMMKMGSNLLCCSRDNIGLQISSLPRTPGIKRRKSQAKKVICIPAPAASGSKPSGEVVPSDLWAWRKYGQKPIKGSPYPRGYYRCSSSKGCSARKQVERSRTDPNMLVITYTSEHNHPWPTQRNALAGSTRSQPSRTNPSPARNNSVRCTRIDVKEKELASGSGPVKEEEKIPAADSAEDRDINGRVFDDFFASLSELEAEGMEELVFSKEEDDDNGEEWEQQEMEQTKGAFQSNKFDKRS